MITKEKKSKMIKEADKAYDGASKYRAYDKSIAAAQKVYDKSLDASHKAYAILIHEEFAKALEEGKKWYLKMKPSFLPDRRHH